jgi:secreted trypsin-like serine protease
MKTKNQISITRKAPYLGMLLGLFFFIFGVGNLPAARAQEGEPVTPTPEVQVQETVTPILEVQIQETVTPTPEVQVQETVTPTPEVGAQIVGGVLADPGEYPWQVEIDNYHSTSHTGSFSLCGGSLIDSQWVLTAAHCITESNGSVSASGFLEVYTGEYNRTGANGYEDRSVIKVIRHSSYNDNTLDNDIALVRLSSPVTIPNGANNLPWTKTDTIPLVPANVGSLAGVNAWVTGWGRTSESGSTADQLRKVQLPIIENSVCNNASHYGGRITDNMMCAGYDAGMKDSCNGDSGGPLVVSNAGQWKLAGIVSWGDGCARVNKPGVYTRVSQYVSWINSNAVPAVLVVQNTNNSGANSLRQAIADAYSGDIITFAPSLSGATIRLASTLNIFNNVTIDGSALASKITISGDTEGNGTGDVQVFSNSATVTLNSLIITKGNYPNGGAIQNYEVGNLTVINSTLYGNSSVNIGGAIFNDGTLAITNSTLSGNSSTNIAGAIYNYGTLTITNSTFSGNTSANVGGIFNTDGAGPGILTVINSTFSGNTSADTGAISNAGTQMTIKNSTFSGNSSSGTSGGGGGISNNRPATVVNSTFSGNSAAFNGGAIYNHGTLNVTNSTLSGNSAGGNTGGGIYNLGILNYTNTIIANSPSGGDCYNVGGYGTIGTKTNNLVEDGTCFASLSGDPNLGALADNGGPTQTMALNTGSKAINAGATCSAAPVNGLDQREFSRKDGFCDIGAYEYGAIPLYKLFLPLILR